MATVTFLFTDIEGSTRLWEAHPQAMKAALAAHDELTSAAVASRGGRVFKHTGDGIAAVFESAGSALEAATAIQQGLAGIEHPPIGALKVRAGVHAGEVEERDGDYFGVTVSRTARLMSTGHGGQTLVSRVTGELVADDGFRFRDLGEHRLRDLSRPERIFQLVVDGMTDEFPPLRTLDHAAHNLPVLTTSFIGRGQELAEVSKLVRGARLVTITGVGGAGKTRVALHAAAEMAVAAPDGVWLVELAAVTVPELVDGAFVDALRVSQPSGTTARQALLEHLAPLTSLLVVDNCEHLIGPAAETIEDILAHTTDVKVIATSRELLGVPGEVSYGLRSMRLPAAEADPVAIRTSDAVQLFVERASAARPDFHLTAENLAPVLEICRRLDGMPLAIELATARLRSFSPAQIAEHLDQRFRLLTGGSRTALPRQQTLTAAIDWSYRLLSDAERALFRRLSVFQGGFTFESVSAVCAGEGIEEFDLFELLPGLVDKSLVQTDDTDQERVRYRLLETLRQFARERLDEEGTTDLWRARHARHFGVALQGFTVQATAGADAPMWRRRVGLELDNLRQAATWALGAGEADLALRVVVVLSRWFLGEGRWSEPADWLSQLMELDETLSEYGQAQLRQFRGAAHSYSDEPERAVSLFEDAVGRYRRLVEHDMKPEVVASFMSALNGLAYVLYHQGRAGDRNELYTELEIELLEIARAAGDRLWIAMALANLAHHRDPHGDPAESRARFAEAEEASRDFGPSMRADLANRRAFFEFDQGEIEQARDQWARSATLAQEAESDFDQRIGEMGQAVGDRLSGDADASGRFRAVVRRLFDNADLRRGVHQHQLVVVFGALIDLADDRLERVATAAGASQVVAEHGVPVRWDLVDSFDRAVSQARATLGDGAFESARAAGARMSVAEITAFLESG